MCVCVCLCVCIFVCFSRTSANDPPRRLQQLIGWGVVEVFPWRRCLQVPGLHLHLPAAVPGGVPVQHRSSGCVSAAEQPQVRTRKHTNTSLLFIPSFQRRVAKSIWTLIFCGGTDDQKNTLWGRQHVSRCPKTRTWSGSDSWVVSMETVNRKPCKYMLWLWYLQQQIIDRSNKMLSCKYTETCVRTQCKY